MCRWFGIANACVIVSCSSKNINVLEPRAHARWFVFIQERQGPWYSDIALSPRPCRSNVHSSGPSKNARVLGTTDACTDVSCSSKSAKVLSSDVTLSFGYYRFACIVRVHPRSLRSVEPTVLGTTNACTDVSCPSESAKVLGTTNACMDVSCPHKNNVPLDKECIDCH